HAVSSDFLGSHSHGVSYNFYNRTNEHVLEGIAVAKSIAGVTGTIPAPAVDNFFKDTLPRVRDAYPVSLPLPTGQDFIYTPTANPGVDVQMRDDGTLADGTGKVYAPDQVRVKSVPKPRIATDAAGVPILDAAGNPVVAVPVGQIGVGASAIPATLVNVRTGEAVKTETDTANPPLDTVIGKINWAPITGLPAAFTNTFPFSLPWDVKRLVDLMVAAPVVPRIEADFYGEKMVITLPRMVTDNILLIRSGIIIAVLLGLVFATRRLLGGAQ
uniref:hypothetical protein n=1 Tax=Saccharibacillus qingshengii TaxID=1763540 RepID=UPI001555ADD9